MNKTIEMVGEYYRLSLPTVKTVGCIPTRPALRVHGDWCAGDTNAQPLGESAS